MGGGAVFLPPLLALSCRRMRGPPALLNVPCSEIEPRVFYLWCWLIFHLNETPGFSGGPSSKPISQCRRRKRCEFDPWVGKIPGGGHGNPL